MSAVHVDDWLTIHGGDNREVLRTLPDESVQCVVTSPPYWGLRDYGTAAWDGGDPECDHLNGPLAPPKSTLQGYTGPDVKLAVGGMPYRDRCGKCGATRQDRQLGLERTPEEYVAAMVDVFREVRRVLRRDGTLWLNLGDSYASTGGERTYGSSDNGTGRGPGTRRHDISTLKPKDLVGIPWRVAFALQADGWYLRSDIIWAKPNPMPESVTDRPTKAHEYLFLLAKSERYAYDADAIREAPAESVVARAAYAVGGTKSPVERNDGGRAQERRYSDYLAGRNRRSVWTVATKPYAGSHFATFPEALVEPCILAGTSEAGACATCGAPWRRVVERSGVEGRRDPGGVVGLADAGMYAGRAGSSTFTTTGWRPTCAHPGDPVPCVVMDPFAGTGTVGVVAQRLSRRAVLIDLNPEYLRQCLERNRQAPLGLSA